ncbi:triphosphoribosyl-dephospho-CoA synthase [Gimesia panareensis]|uniref:Triphosphoribosyl-dephospho-CoA synthase n=1 Tax=Gimesia panareensis TaxID=2527978 RepID=A0A517Q2N2_9PLAN|nr:triphosphoribosyl-dephospho-CoA synthase [Gimesia panareensis]QDT25881.1 triphosphoribosyl-dephospho-CoA synthase [Gimesia panareensis]
MSQNNRQLENWCYLACLLEATARKPGNVHPGASFPDLTYVDFLRSARVISPLLARTRSDRIGETILDCVKATRTVSSSNANLGMILLLAPLAAIPAGQTIADGIESVLENLSINDARLVYQAIRLACPGGLGETEAQDISDEPTGTLREVMALAADRDAVAREYASGFQITLKTAIPALQTYWKQSADWETAVIRLQLKLMADCPDTLIARKCGRAEAEEAAQRARETLQAEDFETSLLELDRWLRETENRRNPGTTADLIVAALFVAFRDGFITPPPASTIREKIPPSFQVELSSLIHEG